MENDPTTAEHAARITAAAAVLADYRTDATRPGEGTDWHSWAYRLASVLGAVLGIAGQAPAALPPGRSCAACGITGQPLAVTRFRGIGDTDWQELWRCEDIRACHDRLFPDLARLPGHAPAGAPALTAEQLAVLGPALADAIAYRDPAGRCDDCEAHPAGLCEDHAADLDKTDAYLALARTLGIEVDR